MKATRTWVLIADAGRARVLENDGPGHGLIPVERMGMTHELPRTHELVADRQPRSIESVGHARHAIDAGMDPHRKEKQKFASEIAAVLDKELAGNAFDRLVIVAAPQALGDLRAAISEAVQKRVHNEIALDLTKTPNEDVARHLGHILAL